MNPFASSFNPNASSFTPGGAKPAEEAAPAPEPKKEEPKKEEPKKEEPKKEEPKKEAAAPEKKEEEWEKEGKKDEKAADADADADDDTPEVVEEAPKKKKIVYESIEEADPRERINVVFIGHVDAGKSTIGGHLLYLTGMVDERTIQKYEREAKAANRGSWYIAYVLDQNEEERAKGKTVEVGRARFETEKKRYTLLDAPGHKNYVPNMIGGVSQADIGILVISARKGEFEAGFEKGGQTREHAMLAKTLGVQKLVVVINKMDEQTVNWSVKRYTDIEEKLSPFLRQVGFKKDDVTFLPLSGLTGANIKDDLEKGIFDHYTGHSLVNTLDAFAPLDRQLDAPLRMPVIDRYKDMGTVMMGKIEAGRVAVGDTVTIMPNSRNVKVLGITYNDDEIRTAKAGDNICLRVDTVSEDEVRPGHVVCSPDNLCQVFTDFEAQIVLLEMLEHKPLFTAGYEAVLHLHSCVEELSVIKLNHLIDRKTGKKSKRPPMFVKAGAVIVATLRTENAVSGETFADAAQLGRFSLRDEGKTIAFGKIVKINGVHVPEETYGQ
eukprot:TRINITY_DN927_c0_g1_i2.p1 TRINITY_DN927_c0_g1~~TRINITY_DN927_c0_g1_i2.p1  ORF type:complete len:550 (-),score=230.25 TRINITY_DN927_c0_g1_i2:260-1909(-)